MRPFSLPAFKPICLESLPYMSGARFASALSTASDLDLAASRTVGRVAAELGGPASLACLFLTQHFQGDLKAVANLICDQLGTNNLIGCVAESVAGVNQEVEDNPGLALWAMAEPRQEISLSHVQFERTPDGSLFTGWPEGYELDWPSDAGILAIGDPYSFPADHLLEQINELHPGVLVCGGMASGATAPGESRIFYGREVVSRGAVLAFLRGPVRMRTLVSQGCRPIGKPMVVTKAERNVIFELGGKPALLQLKELFATLPTSEQALVQKGVHVGIVVSEYKEKFEYGDFLIRNVTGFDQNVHAIAIGDWVRVGQTVQFHIRDRDTADDDLHQHLKQAKKSIAAPEAALLFTCNGRGTRFFSEPHHDATSIGVTLGQIPMAGFFAAGELGPVSGKNYMHGYTASIALFNG
jgi:small ligand-binding sensory domain FIST